MNKNNEIKATIALGALHITNINPEIIKKIEEDEILRQLANAFQHFWIKLWIRWDCDNNSWPFTTEYNYEVFQATANLLCERLKYSQPLLCKAIQLSVNMWEGEYKRRLKNEPS